MDGIGRINVLAAHTDKVVEAGLTAIVGRSLEMHAVPPIIGHASDEHILHMCVREYVTVLVADYSRGLRISSLARRSHVTEGDSALKVLVLTDRKGQADVRAALAGGIQGYLLCGCSDSDVSSGIQDLRAGKRHYCDAVVDRIVDDLITQKLTGRELQIIELVAAGSPNKVIAERLGVKVGTVKTHVAAILEKLNARNRTEAASIANQRGLIGPASERHEFVPPPRAEGKAPLQCLNWTRAGGLRGMRSQLSILVEGQRRAGF
jgi:DNA-binding NarL/FixJ family response regulator